jgi:hypothetical protein
LRSLKKGIASIVHIKNNYAGYPMQELGDNLRNCPGGSYLELRGTIDGTKVIALAAKYNSKSTCFFCAPEGAAPTTEEEPYVTKWPDNYRNVKHREVPRPAMCSRYFMLFNKVDVHDQRRQHELGLEMKWVNELDGTVVRPPLDKRRSLTSAATFDEVADNAAKHPLVPFGTYDSGNPIQLLCVMCGMKATTFLQQPCV